MDYVSILPSSNALHLSELSKHRIPPIITNTEWGKGNGINRRAASPAIWGNTSGFNKITIIKESGIEIRITTPPIFILTTPIPVPISEITPAIRYQRMLALPIVIGIKEAPKRYSIPPIPLKNNAVFFLASFFLILSSTSFSEIGITFNNTILSNYYINIDMRV
jgi:hypothetical protein